MKTITSPVGQTTTYAYDLATRTTTITNPPDAGGAVGTVRMVYDSYGMLLTTTDPLNHTTTNVYDTNHKSDLGHGSPESHNELHLQCQRQSHLGDEPAQ